MSALRETLASAREDRGASEGVFRLPIEAEELRSAGEWVALPCRLLLMPEPRSYTGEDVAELIVPGHPDLVRRMVERLERVKGVRHAEPGEFTARAFLNGRMTSEQAEGVQAIIAARSEVQLDAGRRLLSGELGRTYRRLADELASALALVEAGIDFTEEEDVVAIAPDDLRARLTSIRGELEELAGPGVDREAADDLAMIALAGPPNAGKSTLFNALLGRTRSIVSNQAGTTRDVLREACDLREPGATATQLVTLIDLAGLDAALSERCEIDRESQKLAHETLQRADVIAWCDPTGRFERAGEEAQRVITESRKRGQSVLRVRTKADLPGDHSGDSELALAVCALDGWNLGALRRAMLDGVSRVRRSEEQILLPRHRKVIQAAMQHVIEAIEALPEQNGEGGLDQAEIIAGSMRAALDDLGSIAGHISPDDVIGRIFATFCIGK